MSDSKLNMGAFRGAICLFVSVLSACGQGESPPDLGDQVSLGFERLLEEAAAPADAYVSLNRAIDAYLAQATDMELATREIEAASYALLESEESRARLVEASNNLRGTVFLEDGPSVLAGLPVAEAQLSPSTDTVVLFVNGLANAADANVRSRAVLLRCVRSAGRDFDGVAVGSYYNRSAVESCVRRHDDGFLGKLVMLVEKAGCYADDLNVGVRSWLGLPVQEQDAADLASALRTLTAHDRKTVIVAHSDGNHVTRDALNLLRRPDSAGGSHDDREVARAVGVVMVGSPIPPSDMPVTGINTPGNREKVAWVGLGGDPVAWVGSLGEFLSEPWIDSCPGQIGPITTRAIDMAGRLSRLGAIGLLDPYDQYLTSDRQQALSDLGAAWDALSAEVAATNCEPSWLALNHGADLSDVLRRNFHLFTGSYLSAGSTTKSTILNEIKRIRAELQDDAQPQEMAAACPLVSASGRLGPTEGEFEIAVSPQNDQGQFVGADLPQSAFRFAGVTATDEAGESQEALFAQVTAVVVESAKAEFLTAVVVLDSSGSMQSNDPGAVGRREGANAFFDHFESGDEAAVLDFPGDFSNVRLLQDFTTDTDLLRDSLSYLREDGGTPLYEAVLEALRMLKDRVGAGGVVVVLTDGQANGVATVAQAVAEAQSQVAPVFAVGLGSSLGFDELRVLGNQTGGGFVEATDAAELKATFSGIGTGIKVGRVTVLGRALFPGLTSGRYVLRGKLVTDDPGSARIETPFDFTADVQ